MKWGVWGVTVFKMTLVLVAAARMPNSNTYEIRSSSYTVLQQLSHYYHIIITLSHYHHFYIRDMVESLEIVVPFVPTKFNLADFFTKCLDLATFQRHRAAIMNISADAP